jgi:hypothetical protein
MTVHTLGVFLKDPERDSVQQLSGSHCCAGGRPEPLRKGAARRTSSRNDDQRQLGIEIAN